MYGGKVQLLSKLVSCNGKQAICILHISVVYQHVSYSLFNYRLTLWNVSPVKCFSSRTHYGF